MYKMIEISIYNISLSAKHTDSIGTPGIQRQPNIISVCSDNLR